MLNYRKNEILHLLCYCSQSESVYSTHQKKDSWSKEAINLLLHIIFTLCMWNSMCNGMSKIHIACKNNNLKNYIICNFHMDCNILHDYANKIGKD